MFLTRLLSGIVLILVMLGLFLAGGDILLAAMLVVSLIGVFELYRVFSLERSPLGRVGYAAVVCYYVNLRFSILEKSFFISLFLILLFFVYVLRYPRDPLGSVLEVFFGFFYVALMLSYIYELRMMDAGIYLVWLILLCSWGSDTCAYCVGMLFGRHKMTPKLSPKKSIEGAVGGVVGAMLLSAAYGSVFFDQLDLPDGGLFLLVLITGAGALISMVGDLAASAIKRNYQIKDYGTLIPGHGGILDRFDSVIITAPIIYGLCRYL